MKKRTTAVLTAVLGLLVWAAPMGPINPVRAASAEPPGCTVVYAVSVCADLAYGPNAAATSGSTQRLDIFKPLGAGPFPVIVWLHGGGWSGGDRKSGVFSVNEDWNGLVRQVTRGYAVVAVDYRLASSTVSFPTPLYDVKQAVRWLKWQSGTYGLSPTKIALGGHSAGGHLATLATATTGQNRYEPTSFGAGFGQLANYTSTTKVAIGYAGVYDFRRNLDLNPYFGPGVADGASFFLHCDMPGGAAGVIPDAWPDCTTAQRYEASPIKYLAGVPTYLAHGDDDPIVEPAQADLYKATRDAAGQPTGLSVVPGGGHGGSVPLWRDGLAPTLDFVLDVYVRNG